VQDELKVSSQGAFRLRHIFRHDGPRKKSRKSERSLLTRNIKGDEVGMCEGSPREREFLEFRP
jgi:hypothetical protein